MRDPVRAILDDPHRIRLVERSHVTSRRDFLKTLGATGAVLAGSDLIARSPRAVAARARAGLEVQGAGRHRARRSEDGGLQLRRHPLHARVNSGVNANGGNHGAGRRRRRVRRGRRRCAAEVAAAAAEAAAAFRRRAGGGSAAAAASAPDDRRGRLRRARDPQRRVGLRQQPDRHRGRDPPDHAHRGRSRQGERDREEDRRQARAGAGLPDLLGDADREGSRLDLRAKTSRTSCRRSSTPS